MHYLNYYRPYIPYPGMLTGTSVIPKLNWDVYSQEQRIHAIVHELKHLIESYNDTQDAYNKLIDIVQQLQDEFDEFMNSGFDDYYKEQVAAWINDNLNYIFESMVKQVYFGLTDDGYFCAYIPDSWSDIEFDTGMVYGQFDYGRLILRFNADGSGVIDNTGRYDELNSNIERILGTLYSPMKEGGDL